MKFTPLLLFLLAGAALAQDDAGDDLRPLSLPGDFGIGLRWKAAEAGALDAATAQRFLQEDADGSNVVACGERQYASLWSAIDRRLAEQPQAAAGLRALEDAEAPAQVAAARRTGDPVRLLAVCRRYPWAEAVHAALLDRGEQLPREGHGGLALRCFDDMVRRGGNLAMRRRAQAAVWLAAAQAACSPHELETAIASAGEGTYPWLREPAAAGAIAERLKAGMKPDGTAPPVQSLEEQPLALPSAPAWLYQLGIRGQRNPVDEANRSRLVPTSVSPIAGEEGVLVAGPNLLAWYAGEDLQRPQWQQATACGVSLRLWAMVAPGPFQPAVADGRIFTRWGIDQSKPTPEVHGEENPWANRLKDVAAFDCANGRVLWSTADDPAWQELFPVNDPAYADGRVYVLATAKNRDHSPLVLVSLDAFTGSVLWNRELLAGRTTFVVQPALHEGRWASNRSVDLVHFGNAVTVVGGAVYWSSNMGMVGRCDARDGLIEWMAAYEQNAAQANLAALISRQGAPPLCCGKQTIFTPRDTTSVLAFDRDTGAASWQQTAAGLAEAADAPAPDPAPPGASREARIGQANDANVSLEAISLFGDTVLVAAGRRIAALRLASGETKWARTLDEPAELPAWLVGSALYVNTHSQLLQIDAATGADLAAHPWQPPTHLAGIALRGNTLLVAQPGDRGIAVEDVPPTERPRRGDAYSYPPDFYNRPFRAMYRSPQPHQPDGDPSDWEPENTVVWRDRQGGEGKAWFSHADEYLYLGINHPAPDVRPRQGHGARGAGDWLEFQIPGSNRKVVHCAIGIDRRGRVMWENLGRHPLPPGLRAAIGHQLADCRLTYEIEIPLASLLGRDGSAFHNGFGAWHYVAMTLHGDGARTGQPEASIEIGGVSEKLNVQPATLADDLVLQNLAQQFPDLDESWQYMYDMWQRQAPGGAKPSDFYRQYIEQHPNARELKTAQARLEQLLTNDTQRGVQSLAPVDPVPYATEQLTTALSYRLPKVRFSQYVARLWRRVDALLVSDPTARTSLRKVLLQNAPATDVPKWLDQFYRADMDDPNGLPALEQLTGECGLPEDVLSEFRPGARHCFLRTWRVIGPFPSAAEAAHDTVYPVEQQPVAISAHYSGTGGKVAWRLVTSERDKVDLSSVFTGDPAGVAYAVCWVETTEQKAAMLEIGTNDGFKVWVNRKLVLDDEFRRRAEPGQNSARADLLSGWNEILVKLDNRFGPCCFFLELRDTATGKPWQGLKVCTDPPPDAELTSRSDFAEDRH